MKTCWLAQAKTTTQEMLQSYNGCPRHLCKAEGDDNFLDLLMIMFRAAQSSTHFRLQYVST